MKTAILGGGVGRVVKEGGVGGGERVTFEVPSVLAAPAEVLIAALLAYTGSNSSSPRQRYERGQGSVLRALLPPSGSFEHAHSETGFTALETCCTFGFKLIEHSQAVPRDPPQPLALLLASL